MSRHSSGSRDSRRRRFYITKSIPQSGSPESEDEPRIKPLSSKHVTNSWKVKVSNHIAPPEQEERYIRTRERVRDVAQNILGYGSLATKDFLELGASVFQFAPVDGLGAAATTLLVIWNALELVESNQLACLSLTERCVDTLVILRDEISEAGVNIENQLQFPLVQLNESFNAAKKLLQAQAHRPFYKRYLRRKEIQKEIEACDAKLSNALELFSLKIQIRSLQRLEVAEAKRRVGELRTRRDLERLLESLPDKIKKQEKLTLSGVMTVAETVPTLNAEGSSTSDHADKEEASALTIPESEGIADQSAMRGVREKMDDLVVKKNNRDFALDLAELRSLMREALENSSDASLLDVLQIKREEVQEVLKELQHALEDTREGNDDVPGEQNPESPTVSRNPVNEILMTGISRACTTRARLYEEDISDELDKTFIEHSIKALKRSKTV